MWKGCQNGYRRCAGGGQPLTDEFDEGIRRAIRNTDEESVEAFAAGPDPYLGHRFRSLNIHYFNNQLLEEIRNAGKDENSVIYDIEPDVIRRKGDGVVCPRDGKMHASYVDCLHGPDCVGLAVMMVSYSWGYTVGDISSGLMQYCRHRGLLEFKKIYIWMCCFCINQHRVRETIAKGERVPFKDFKHEFESRVQGIGRVVALMAPWRKPRYIQRVWCCFEMFKAMEFRDNYGCSVAVSMPELQSDDLRDTVIRGTGLDDLWDALATLDIKNAEASVEEDKQAILDMIKDGPGFHKVNMSVSKYLQEWVVRTCEKHLDGLIESLPLGAPEAAQLHLCLGNLLRRIGRDDMLERASLHLKQALRIQRANTKINGRRPSNYMGADTAPIGDAPLSPLSPLFPSSFADALAPEDGKNVAHTLNELGSVNLARGDKASAKDCFVQARKIYERMAQLETHDALEVLMNMGAMHRRYGDINEATSTFSEAREIYERMGELHTLGGAKLMMEIGHTQRRLNKFAEARTSYDEAHLILKKLHRLNTPEGATTLLHIGIAMEAQANGEDPYDFYNEARKVREITHTLETPEGAKLLVSLGAMSLKRDDPRGALSSLLEAKRIYQETHTLQTSIGAFALQQLGDVYSQMEQWSDALMAYQDSLKIREKSGTVDRKNGVLLKEAMEHAEEQLSAVSTARRTSLSKIPSCMPVNVGNRSITETTAHTEWSSEAQCSDSIDVHLNTKTTMATSAGVKNPFDLVRAGWRSR
jgi:tetratricopeptide (TPR) repeat protein